MLYGIGEKVFKDIDDASCSLFVEAKRDLEMVPPNHDTLELQITRANCRAKIWLHADHAIMNLENKPPAFYWSARRYILTRRCYKAFASIPRRMYTATVDVRCNACQ